MLCIFALATCSHGVVLCSITSTALLPWCTAVPLVTERARARVRTAGKAAGAVMAAGGVAASVEPMHRH